jgi:LPS-assembly protein
MTASGQRRTLLAVACTLLAIAQARAADTDCPPTPPPATPPTGPGPTPGSAPSTPPPPDNTISYSARETAGSLTDQSTTLRGCVELRYQDRVIKTDEATFDGHKRSVHLPGHFSFEDSTIRVDSQSGGFDPETGAEFHGATFQLLKQPGRGQAETLTRKPNGQIDLGQVTYTTCKDCPPDWQIRARHIELNVESLRGLASDARVEFKGVPILYVPAISFPLSDQRQTGLLFPTFGTSSRNGATLAVPWYWNIAPNQDLTLTPTIYTRRGIDLATEFRMVQRGSDLAVNVNILPYDRVTEDLRSYQKVLAEWRTPDGWRVRLDGQNVSDVHYLEDFAQGTQASSAPFLARQLETSYRSDALQFRALLQQYQTLDLDTAELPVAERPYAVLPRLSLAMQHDFAAAVRAVVDAELAGFAQGTPTGWRADFTPGITWQWTRPGMYLRPALQWNASAYRLSNTAPGANDSPTRSVPIFSIDTGLQLERASPSDTRQVTLEPRLLYVYIPYRDQSALPVFDTGLPDPNFVSLYRINRFMGTDRIGDANRLAVGITGHLYDSGNGQQFLSATVGQSYNFNTLRVSLPGAVPDPRSRSDLIANIDLRALQNWNLRFDAAWNTELSRAQKLQVALQYLVNGGQVVNVDYRFDRDSVEQAGVSAAWPVGHRWEIYARGVYSLRDDRSLETFAGLHFRGDCWGIRTVIRRAVSSRTGAMDTGVYVQFELNGLSNVGTGADTFLQQSIQGYSAAEHR